MSAKEVARIVDYIEKKFSVIVLYDPTTKTPSKAPTGESYISITSMGKGHLFDARTCANAAKEAFDAYAAGRTGVLYWRTKPEMEKHAGKGWQFYMRLLISKKPLQ